MTDLSQLYTSDRNNQSLAWCAGDLYKMENTSMITGIGSTSSVGEGCVLHYQTGGTDRPLGKVALIRT